MTRPSAKSFEDLIVWQKAHRFVLAIYTYSASFPTDERYGLVSQLRRAAVSIPANIAEGFKRRTKADKSRFMNIAHSSAEECRYYLILAQDLNYGDSNHLKAQLNEVTKLLGSYTRSLLAPPS